MSRGPFVEKFHELKQAFLGLFCGEALSFVCDDVFEQLDDIWLRRAQVEYYPDAVMPVDMVDADLVVQGRRCVRAVRLDVLQ